MVNLIVKLSEIDQSLKPEEIQTIVYSSGKENGYEKNLRDWFKLIYEVVFGEENGPRMGYFVSFFGLKETIELMKDTNQQLPLQHQLAWICLHFLRFAQFLMHQL